MKKASAYQEGFDSFKKNRGKLKIPYPQGSEEYNSFERGWLQAQRRASTGLVKNFEKHGASLEALEERKRLDKLAIRKNAYKNRKG